MSQTIYTAGRAEIYAWGNRVRRQMLRRKAQWLLNQEAPGFSRGVRHCIAGNTIDSQPQNGGNGTQFADEGKIVVGSLCAHDGRGFNGQDVEQNKVVYPAGKVRRLTPTECERLQGLPDGYTDIEFKGKPAPDSRRYKALGNGMAQPCADYVIRRIQEVNDSGQTERLGTCRDDRR